VVRTDVATKLMLSIASGVAMALYFTLFYSYLPFEIPQNYMLALELFIVSLPFYFFLVNTEDGLLGVAGGFVYTFSRTLFSNILGEYSLFCIFDAFIFSIAFGIYTTAMAFQKENAMKEAKLSMVGSVSVILAFFVALFMLIVYNTYFTNKYMCVDLLRWFEFC